jgi:hypothetical protein
MGLSGQAPFILGADQERGVGMVAADEMDQPLPDLRESEEVEGADRPARNRAHRMLDRVASPSIKRNSGVNLPEP